MSKYDELVSKYKEFIYERFNYEIIDNVLKINLFYEIPGLEKFNHYIEIPVLHSNLDESCIKRLVFNIGLVEMLSYWKITCSKKLLIKCGKLDDFQTNWFKKLMVNGLGEFFYRNNIILQDDFVSILSSGEEVYECSFNETVDGYLTLVGGGKDSLTSLELIKEKENRKVLIFNNRKICYDGATVAGYKPEDIICVIGPTIRKCHFEVKQDVRDIFYNEFNYMQNIDDIIQYNARTKTYFIDTVVINKNLLQEEGIPEENIIDSKVCTYCNSNIIHSYRKEGEKSGRNTALICLK